MHRRLAIWVSFGLELRPAESWTASALDELRPLLLLHPGPDSRHWEQSARARGTSLRLRRLSPSSPPSSVRVAAARAAVLGLVGRLLRPAPSRRGMGRGRPGYWGLLPGRTPRTESRSVERAPPPAAASLEVHGGRGSQSRQGSAHVALW